MKRLTAALLIALFLPVFMGAEDEKPEAPAPKEEPASLDDSARAIGGIWVAEDGVKDPKAPHGRFTAEWGVGKKLIRSRTYWVQGGKQSLLYEGAQYWHPGRKALVFYEMEHTGNLFEGEIVKLGDEYVTRWSAHTAAGEIKYERRGEYLDDDTMLSRLFEVRDGEPVLVAEYKLLRKPDGWTGDEDKADKEPAD